MTRTVRVDLGERGYDVLVGHGVRSELAGLLPPGVRRAAVVTQDAIGFDVDPGIDHEVFVVPEGENAKSMATVESLCRRFAQWGLTRGDVVIGVGGGVVTDLAGFVAAIYHRGLAVVHVSTTLLGMVDAAIGGKTGVNLPEGKNLVGSFWQPYAVLCDLDALATLPPRESKCGYGEMAKYHFLTGADLQSMDLTERVATCVEIKADVVAEDEREGQFGNGVMHPERSGRRAILNYGHTLAHALETSGRYDLRHGEAVAIGLIYAAELGAQVGRIDADRVAEHRRVVGAYDLATDLPPGSDIDALIALFSRDKKAVDGVTFMLDGRNGVESVTGIARADLLGAFERMGGR
ncbi:MAG: 3-dehydroquinate synthase [Acidimicrobiia bacterium]